MRRSLLQRSFFATTQRFNECIWDYLLPNWACGQLRPHAVRSASANWQSVGCVTDLSIVHVAIMGSRRTIPTISARFTYVVNGREFTGWRIAYCQQGNNIFCGAISKTILLQLERGEHVRVKTIAYFWPRLPRFSVLHPGLGFIGIAESLLRAATLIIIAVSLWNSMHSS